MARESEQAQKKILRSWGPEALQLLKGSKRFNRELSKKGLYKAPWDKVKEEVKKLRKGSDRKLEKPDADHLLEALKGRVHGHDGNPILIESDAESKTTECVQPLIVVDSDTMATLQGTNWLDSAVIFSSLKVFEATNPSVRVIDSLGIFDKQRAIPRETRVLVPFRINENHWVLAVIEADLIEARLYDSMPSDTNWEIAEKEIKNFCEREFVTSNLKFRHSSPQLQLDSYECGSFTIFNGICVILELRQVPFVDPTCLRWFYRELIKPCNEEAEGFDLTTPDTIWESASDLLAMVQEAIKRIDVNHEHFQELTDRLRRAETGLENLCQRMEAGH